MDSGNKNCETSYYENLEIDNTGELHKFALVGFEFEKEISDKRLKNKR